MHDFDDVMLFVSYFDSDMLSISIWLVRTENSGFRGQ